MAGDAKEGDVPVIVELMPKETKAEKTRMLAQFFKSNFRTRPALQVVVLLPVILILGSLIDKSLVWITFSIAAFWFSFERLNHLKLHFNKVISKQTRVSLLSLLKDSPKAHFLLFRTFLPEKWRNG